MINNILVDFPSGFRLIEKSRIDEKSLLIKKAAEIVTKKRK